MIKNNTYNIYNSGSNKASYSYYSDGLRASKTVGSDTTKYYYNGDNVINETLNGSSYATNVMGVNGYVSRRQNGTTGYLFKDAHGDVLSAYSSTTNKLADYAYDAWGEQRSVGDCAWGKGNPIRYNGQYYDTESGMTYLRARYYDSSFRRFITEDPAKDGVNWYAYCGNNPVNRFDPSGKGWFSDGLNDAKQAFKNAAEYANESQKSIQRSFWAAGSQLFLREYYGYETSAWMLEHSLQDNPDDIYRDKNSRIASLVNADSAYLDKLDEVISRSDDGRVIGELKDIQFNSGDLYYSIHKATIYIDGFQQEDGTWLINATMTDKYDFTEIQSFMDDNGGLSWDVGLGTVANDAAVISQKTGAISPYTITVEFDTTR